MRFIIRNLKAFLLALAMLAPVMAQPLTSTLAALTCPQLEAYYTVPAPLGTIVAGSTDPAVFATETYIEQQNAQQYHRYAVDVPNTNTANQYDFTCRTWQSATPRSSYLPVPPAYVVFDGNAFHTWFTMLNATYTNGSAAFGQAAPPLFFVKPAPLPADPIILAAGVTVAPVAVVTDGPIGAAVANNPGVFNSAGASDTFADGYVYLGVTGVYQKHIYSNPFTAGLTRVIWIKLQ